MKALHFARRRRLLLAALASPLAAYGNVIYPPVTPRPLAFPRDHGAHPEFRIEWWYLTGWLDREAARTPAALGFQITFFRLRTDIDPANPSAFAAQQLLIAHAALADPAHGRLLIDERIARAGFGNAAAEHDTDVLLDRWYFKRTADGAYECATPAREFSLRFTARPTQPRLLQGENGVSSKGPRPKQASYYYSAPHLAVDMALTRNGAAERLRGGAWLDHEWSSEYLDPDASGWDWFGMNLDGGGAMTAFQFRHRRDGSKLFAYASLREPQQVAPRRFGIDEVTFEPQRHWRSPRTNASFPVAQRVHVGTRVFETVPLFDDQELDLRASSGLVYWEGASRLRENGRQIGRGYLELTGYANPVMP
ncbi:MAG TPA: carotenoid 1,2-hydratase [Burkholderiaceae bacterium]|nr:carotenoid 1,2-hydratase [Burkholderiaceae bacterium]